MYVKTSRTFVSGHFSWPGRKPIVPRPGRPKVVYEAPEHVAIEILREPSATELIGKLYIKKTSGDWAPIYPNAESLSFYPWYTRFSKGQPIWFEMDGSRRWEVSHLRIESDESGPYVAVALKYPTSK